MKVEIRLKGMPVSPGAVVAKVCLFNERRHENLPVYRVSGGGVERELERFGGAVEAAARQLTKLRAEVSSRIGKAEAEIFTAQLMILEDAGLRARIAGAIRGGQMNAETAIARELEADEARIAALDNEYIRERAGDIGEVKRRLLDVLGMMNPSFQCAGQPHCQKGKNRIVVAEELTPTLTVGLDAADIKGFVTERGGKTSHAAILARALGIPAVTGIKGIHAKLTCGTDLLVNGDTGEVIVNPGAEALAGIAARAAGPVADSPGVGPVPGFEVAANIGVSSDVAEALRHKAEGIGLYRTEFEFFAAGRLLGEDEQFEAYKSAVKAMSGGPVTFRMLDIGGDKTAPFFNLPAEANPYLGFRGGRLLLARPDLFAPQARAIARASKFGPVRVMYPMIVDVEQFRKLKAMFLDTVSSVERGAIEHGVMFEVPSAGLLADELLEEADFGSIGTNDLIQYLFAVDRNNDLVAYDFTAEREVLWRYMAGIADAAARRGKRLTICGETAGDPAYIRRIVSLGISSVSVSARMIPAVRMAAGEIKVQSSRFTVHGSRFEEE